MTLRAPPGRLSSWKKFSISTKKGGDRQWSPPFVLPASRYARTMTDSIPSTLAIFWIVLA